MDDYELDLQRLAERHRRWHLAIGRFIEAMGKAEATTYMVLRITLPTAIYEQMKDAGFSKRLDLVLAVLQSRNLDISSTTAHVQKLKELSRLRNVIAHNPLDLAEFFEELYDLSELERYVIRQARDDRPHSVTLEELEQKYFEAMRTSDLFFMESIELLDDRELRPAPP